MTRIEEEYIRETLLSCLREFEELETQYEWFTSPCPDRIRKAVRMIPRTICCDEVMVVGFGLGEKSDNQDND